MEKDRGFRVMAIIAIIISIVGLTVGFASLSETLRINTAAKLKGGNWSVKFINAASAPELTGTASGTMELNGESTILTVTADLKKPGDKLVYTFDVTNDGDLDAVLSATPVFSGDTAEATAAKVKYSLTYANGDPIELNNSLSVDETRNLKLTVEFDPLATSIVSEDITFNLSVALIYIQA